MPVYGASEFDTERLLGTRIVTSQCEKKRKEKVWLIRTTFTGCGDFFFALKKED